MRSLFFLAAAAGPSLIAAAPTAVDTTAVPEKFPKIYDAKFSGNGCASNAGAENPNGVLSTFAHVKFNELQGEASKNCEFHLQASGASPGWQVAVSDIEYFGDVELEPDSTLNALSSSFYSENAADTSNFKSTLTCTGSKLKQSISLKSKPDVLTWSRCTGADGYTGILNVNHRPAFAKGKGYYSIKQARWGLTWRKC